MSCIAFGVVSFVRIWSCLVSVGWLLHQLRKLCKDAWFLVNYVIKKCIYIVSLGFDVVFIIIFLGKNSTPMGT